MSLGPKCPANDTMPYGTRCIAFLTGWFWQPNISDATVQLH
jgi:hypothetical protein